MATSVSDVVLAHPKDAPALGVLAACKVFDVDIKTEEDANLKKTDPVSLKFGAR